MDEGVESAEEGGERGVAWMRRAGLGWGLGRRESLGSGERRGQEWRGAGLPGGGGATVGPGGESLGEARGGGRRGGVIGRAGRGAGLAP